MLLLSEPPADSRATSLFRLHLVPACAPQLARQQPLSDPVAISENVLIIHKGRPDAWSNWFRLAGIKPEPHVRMIYLDSMFAVARAAEQGLGIALVPSPLTDAWFSSKALIQLSNKKLDTSEHYYFLYRRESSADSDIIALRDWVTSTFSDE